MPTNKLGSGLKKISLFGKDIILFRNQHGKASALLDRCAHRFTPLSLGKIDKNRKVVCPYHGWSFDSAGSGFGPHQLEKNCRIPKFDVIESHDYIWLGNKQATQTLPDKPDTDDWSYIGNIDLAFKAPLHVVLDNFSEDEHFPFVHSILGWDKKGAKYVRFNHKVGSDQIDIEYIGPQRSFPLMELFLIPKNSLFRNRWSMRYDPLKFVFLSDLINNEGQQLSHACFRTEIFFVPETENQTGLHLFLFAKYKSKRIKSLMSLTIPLFKNMIKNDILRDVHFCEKIPHIPYSTAGMVFRDYDQPIKASRKLLSEIYFGGSGN